METTQRLRCGSREAPGSSVSEIDERRRTGTNAAQLARMSDRCRRHARIPRNTPYTMRSHEGLRDQVPRLLAAMQADARAEVTTV
jgi:hypothetical protein